MTFFTSSTPKPMSGEAKTAEETFSHDRDKKKLLRSEAAFETVGDNELALLRETRCE